VIHNYFKYYDLNIISMLILSTTQFRIIIMLKKFKYINIDLISQINFRNYKNYNKKSRNNEEMQRNYELQNFTK